MKSIEVLEQRLGYCFRDKELLRLALTHPSSRQGSYQRLEFLGDSVLGLVVSEYLYLALPMAGEGILTRMKSYLVSSDVLYQIGVMLNIEEFIIHNSVSVKKAVVDCCEAIIGAVYLDGGLDLVKELIERLWIPIIERLEVSDIVNPKELLQLYSQSSRKDNPEYKVLEILGPKHRPEFTVGVFLQSQLLGTGKGPNKKQAESMAAWDALRKIVNSREER